MIFRFLLAALLLAGGALHAEPLVEKPGFVPKLIIYLARGPANSCGLGCDRWIAVEGEVDHGAASRIRRFLRDVRDTRRPIYFYSPGGVVEQSFAIARLLRNRKAIARIGQPIVTACAAGAQIDEACLKIKTGGGEVQAEIATRNAVCNSACGYMFLGATTREVGPDAVMAVHNSKLTFVLHGHPSAQQLMDLRGRGRAKADRERTAFIAAMGIGHELDDLIKTVKFENPHVLTRAELYHFGIDTRLLSETAWAVQNATRPYVRKMVVASQAGGASFRMMEWRLFCENKDRARLMFVREFDPAAVGISSVIMVMGPEKSVAFGQFPARIGKYEAWSNAIEPATMNAMLAASRLEVGEGTAAPHGKTKLSTFEIDTDGLQPAWMQLLASCPAAPRNARPALAPGLASAPAP